VCEGSTVYPRLDLACPAVFLLVISNPSCSDGRGSKACTEDAFTYAMLTVDRDSSMNRISPCPTISTLQLETLSWSVLARAVFFDDAASLQANFCAVANPRLLDDGLPILNNWIPIQSSSCPAG